MTSLKDLVAAAPGLSCRPDSVVSLMEIIEDPVVEAEKLVPIVEHDPGLAAGLLKLCNSPLYSFKRRIGSPREALVLVGNLTFARLCFTLSLEPILHRDLPGYNLDLDTLWQHSLTTAYGSAFLVKAMGLGEMRDRAFTAGLLHDIGKLVLDGGLAAAPTAADDEPGRGRVTTEEEKARTGYTHAEAGAALLESWDLPEATVEAIRFHHAPQDARNNRRLALAVNVADQVAHFAPRLRPGSRAVELWIRNNFNTADFSHDAIGNLAGVIGSKKENVMSLALGPSL